MRVRRAAAVLVAALTCATTGLLAPAAARASGGSWGPDHVPLRAGVVCDDGGTSTALAAWSAGFALAPITDDGQDVSEPATGSVAVPVAPGGGLDATTIAQLAYLIAEHGSGGDAAAAEVAADVLDANGTATADTENCLDSGAGGASAGQAAALESQAQEFAGPYTVTLQAPTTPVQPGTTVAVPVSVVSASGVGVPHVTVALSASGAADLPDGATVRTGATGQATVRVRLTTAAGAPSLTAQAQVATGLVETSEPGRVPVVRPDGPVTASATAVLALDRTPDPQLTLTGTSGLALTSATRTPRIGVTGLYGHPATAVVTVVGPLSLPAGGCPAAGSAAWSAAPREPVESSTVGFAGDATTAAATTPPLAAGCYRTSAALTVTDVAPTIRASVVGGVLAVVPVSVALDDAGHGLATPGTLSAGLTATGRAGLTWSAVSARLLGPLASDAGTCPTTGWTGTGTAATATTGSATAALASAAVTGLGCYAFTVRATLQVPGLGSTVVTVAAGPPVHVIEPAVTLLGVSSTGVDVGNRLGATVALTNTDGQPGTLSLRLFRLPYTYRGCFAADWTNARAVTTAAAPVRATTKDGTYTVSTAGVPATGCFTVVPVFVARANPQVRASTVAGVDPMIAFTAVRRPAPPPVQDLAAASDDAPRLWTAGGVVVALLASCVAGAVIAARRVRRRRPPVRPGDRLFV